MFRPLARFRGQQAARKTVRQGVSEKSFSLGRETREMNDAKFITAVHMLHAMFINLLGRELITRLYYASIK